MSSLIEEFKRKRHFYCETSATAEAIERAEKTLGLTFAEDYKEYLFHFGSVSCGGHELTGISKDKNLDVTAVTLKNLQQNPYIDIPLYVIEETHMDGIVIWQSPSGEVFQSGYQQAPVKTYASLMEYISTFENH